MRVEHTYIHECEEMSPGYDCRLVFVEKATPPFRFPQATYWQFFSRNVSTWTFDRFNCCPQCGVNLNDELLAWKRDNGV